MRECSKCNIAQPLSEFRFRKSRQRHVTVCKACERNIQRVNYWADPEKGRAKAARSMRKRRADPNKAPAIREKARAYYHAKGKYADREYHKRIRAEAPWKWRTRNARQNCSSQITEEWLRSKFEEQSGRCALTGRPITVETFEIDHIIPRSRGGGDELTNLRLLCSEANQAKGAMTDCELIAFCEELIGHAILQSLDHTRSDSTDAVAFAGGSDRPFHRGKYNNA